MRRRFPIAAILVSVLLLVFAKLVLAENLTDQVSGNIRARINAVEVSSQSACVDAVLWRSELLPKFYAEREFRPAWSDDYAPIPYVEDFLEVISEAAREGQKGDCFIMSLRVKRTKQPQKAVNTKIATFSPVARNDTLIL